MTNFSLYSQYLEMHFVFANIKDFSSLTSNKIIKDYVTLFCSKRMKEGTAWGNFLKHLYKEMTSNSRHEVLIYLST